MAEAAAVSQKSSSSSYPHRFGSLFTFLNDDEYHHNNSAKKKQEDPVEKTQSALRGSANGKRESKMQPSPIIDRTSPFYCNPSILSSSVSHRKQLRSEERKNRSHGSVLSFHADPSESPHHSQPARFQQSSSSSKSNRILLSTYLRAQTPKGFDFNNLDRSATAPFYGGDNSSPTKQSKGTAQEMSRNRSRVASPAKSEEPFEPLESLLSASSEFNKNRISHGSLMRHKSAQSSPMKVSALHKSANYQKVPAKIQPYESFMSKVIKRAEKVERTGRKQLDGVYDNFIEVKLDRTSPVIFGLSQNYRALNVKPPETPEPHDYKRHKMKKSQFLVRSVVKYIEKERQTVHLSNYDKSFQRLKESIVPSNSSGNGYATDGGASGHELTNTENDIVRMLTERTKKAASIARAKKKARINNHMTRKSAIAEASDSDDSSSERYKQLKENEQKEKIRKEIIAIREKKEKEAMQEKFYSQARGAKLLHRQNIISWAKTHQLDDLESIQKYKESINNPESEHFVRQPPAEKAQGNPPHQCNKPSSKGSPQPQKRRSSNSALSGGKKSMKPASSFAQAAKGDAMTASNASNTSVRNGAVGGFSSILAEKKADTAIAGHATAPAIPLTNQNVRDEVDVEDKAEEFQFKSQNIMQRIIELGRQNDAQKARILNQRMRQKQSFLNTNSPNGKNQYEGDRISTEGSAFNDDTPSKRRSISFVLPGPMLQQNSVHSTDSTNANKPSTFKLSSASLKKSDTLDDKASPTRKQASGAPTNAAAAAMEVAAGTVSHQALHPPRMFYEELEAVIYDIHTGGYS